MSISLQSSEGPASEDALAALEQRLGAPLPADYRRFQQAYGGGRPRPGAFDIQWRAGQPPADDWRSSSLAWLYFVGNDDEESVALANLVDFRGRLPKDTLAIGRDAAGNQLLLALAGPQPGQVLFWCKDHEAGEGTTPGHDNVGVVASSFQDLLDHRLR